jgi:acyl-CoA reductase-like NAD-dependent aldehyde dehydrogenase
VDQTETNISAAQLASSLEARAVAIVDRSADIDAAAKAIVTARFSFQGMSPYAPDLVIVNEFIKKDFFEACTRYASQYFASHPAAPRSAEHPSRVSQKAIKDAEEKGQLSSFGSSTFMLVDISERYCDLSI